MIPLLLLPLGAIAIPLLSLATGQKKIFASIALFLLALSLASVFLPEPNIGVSSTLFAVDGLGRFFSFLFLLVAFLVGLFTLDSESKHPAVFYSMLLAGTSSMIVVSLAKNLIGIFIGLELLSLCFYELCAFKKDPSGLESAMKLYFMSLFASALFVLGAVLVYGETRTLELRTFFVSPATPAFLMGVSLIVAGLSFKMSLFPFNFWLPDVYEGAPSEVTALLAASAKKAGFAAFVRVVAPLATLSVSNPALLQISGKLQGALALLSFLTMSFGNVIAMVQKSVKRMIAYSIIAHAGFLAIGLAAGSALGYLGLLFHILVHALMAAGIFLLFSVFDGQSLETLDDYDGLGKRAPLISVLLTVFLLSLTGIPPLAGFLSKFILWSSAMEAGYVWLAVAAIINSALSTYFYFLILRRVWGFAPRDGNPTPVVSWNKKCALLIPAILLAVLGVYPNPILSVLKNIIAASGLVA
ncbi:MAG: hypothetical protein A3A28_00075 [Candidatus Sungbacteria bacterium RIFCSPLOWO2_01_FULL_47_32]|uniref:NADH-quinone oxidoreductase subunit N n=1 Tax=Candidatus Sungbacteria bacterium RIFCSPHIGHO2_01_FULL_47_32 TaxID=1802264 RepID=A0A1G2K6B4_9BACT|nr:MAG: Proton-translocating NADH-quinone oxidoreductase subunit N [Parcubacteria group bacterium GW2011_GWA2_47_10]OGZ94733.1 MAG: hypothetical protein A2633_03680 [Candidatus Sungbacteria bacterium RIFCSPHIGHO2_01_FULL_47_32]OHA05191.1 MAG: hypothetical protein A3A28_00075 [Candidatus Sungbacteria bacterium RIFCSPLOWO2_01_FULL_47_32]